MALRHAFTPVLALALALAAGGCGDPTFELSVPFVARYVTPNDGSVVAGADAEGLALFAAFSADLDPATTGGVALLRDGQPVPVELSVTGPELTAGHGALEPGAYTFVLPSTIASAEGDALSYEIRVDFEVGDGG